MNLYPIRTISELTGVSSVTLRAWERRYGLLNPTRTAKGHRQYSSEDIDLIRKIVTLLKANHSIRDAIRITRNPQQTALAEATAEDHWTIYQQQMAKAIEQFHQQNLDKVYNEALAVYPVDTVNERLIIPVLEKLGENWQAREAGIAEEHFFSAFLRNKLGARLHHEANRSRGNKILVSCLPGEYHELGILLFCIAAMGHGYQILYLGTDMPPAQLAVVAQRTDVVAILLSGTRASQWNEPLASEVEQQLVPLGIPILFGGEISAVHEAQIQALGAYALGADHASALLKMESIIPAFNQAFNPGLAAK